MNDKSKAPTFEIASKFVKKNDGEIITSDTPFLKENERPTTPTSLSDMIASPAPSKKRKRSKIQQKITKTLGASKMDPMIEQAMLPMKKFQQDFGESHSNIQTPFPKKTKSLIATTSNYVDPWSDDKRQFGSEVFWSLNSPKSNGISPKFSNPSSHINGTAPFSPIQNSTLLYQNPPSFPSPPTTFPQSPLFSFSQPLQYTYQNKENFQQNQHHQQRQLNVGYENPIPFIAEEIQPQRFVPFPTSRNLGNTTNTTTKTTMDIFAPTIENSFSLSLRSQEQIMSDANQVKFNNVAQQMNGNNEQAAKQPYSINQYQTDWTIEE